MIKFSIKTTYLFHTKFKFTPNYTAITINILYILFHYVRLIFLSFHPKKIKRKHYINKNVIKSDCDTNTAHYK